MVDELEDYSHIIFNIMSKPSLATPLNKYLIIGGALGAAYAFFTYLSSRKASKELSLAATRQILKEVKYQIYTFCIPFAEAVSDKLKGGNQPKDLENYFKSELAKGYGVKEDLIISKYSASKEEYAAALQNYRKDKEVKEGQAEIIKILEDTVKGRIDLTVPAPASRLYAPNEIVALYRELIQNISLSVSEKLNSSIRDNPAFDPKDDAFYKRAMKELNIYEYKCKFLAEKGFKEEWGCPNTTFLKILEDLKRESPEIKAETTHLDRAYTSIITAISNDPRSFHKAHILKVMDEEIAKSKAQANPKQPAQLARSQPVQAPKQVPVNLSKSVKVAPQQPKKEEDEYDMEKLMMEELLSRSQEQPREQKKEEQVVPPVQQVVPPAVEQVVPPAVEQVAPPAVEQVVPPVVAQVVPPQVEIQQVQESNPVEPKAEQPLQQVEVKEERQPEQHHVELEEEHKPAEQEAQIEPVEVEVEHLHEQKHQAHQIISEIPEVSEIHQHPVLEVAHPEPEEAAEKQE